MRLPIGTAIETTRDNVLEIENYIKNKYMNESIKEQNQVVNFVSFIGESAPRFWLSYDQELASVEYSTILVNLRVYDNLEKIKKDIESFAKSKFPDMQVTAKSLGNGPPVKKPIEIRISGKDIDKLFSLASIIKQELGKIKGVIGIVDDWGGIRNKKTCR